MIEEILNSALKFEGINESEKFARQFKSLYGIGVFKDGLDLVLTKARQGNVIFEVKFVKGWSTDDGCCVTDEQKIYNKFIKAFTKKLSHKIIIRNFATNVLAHEMGHCIASESSLTLSEDFRTAIGLDMKNRAPENVALGSKIQGLMIDALKSYPANQILPELFARYFELLANSRDVDPNGNFTTSQITDFFINTTKWMNEVFNPKIKSQIDLDIANHTAKIIAENQFKSETKFADAAKSFHKQSDESGKKSFSKNVSSNSKWQESWQKHQELEDKNNN